MRGESLNTASTSFRAKVSPPPWAEGPGCLGRDLRVFEAWSVACSGRAVIVPAPRRIENVAECDFIYTWRHSYVSQNSELSDAGQTPAYSMSLQSTSSPSA